MLNQQQFYRLQRLLVILAVSCIILRATNEIGVLAFVTAPVGLFFYPQLVFSLVLVTGGNLFLMALGAYQLTLPVSTGNRWRQSLGWLIVGIVGLIGLDYLGTVIQLAANTPLRFADVLRIRPQLPTAVLETLAGVLGFFVVQPWLRRFAQGARRRTIKTLCWIQLGVMGLVPFGLFLMGVTLRGNFLVVIINGWFYALLGYWLNQRAWLRTVTRQQLLVAWVLTAGCYFLMVVFTMYRANLVGNLGVIIEQSFVQTWQAIPCATIWLTLATWIVNRPRLVTIRPHNFLAGGYGVLLMAVLLLPLFKVVLSLSRPLLGTSLGSVAWVGVTVIVSDWLVRLCRLAPIFRRVLPKLFFDTVVMEEQQHAKTGSMD